MKINIGKYTDIDTNKKYTITTKYPYVLPAILADIVIASIVFKWHLASKQKDILSEYTRLVQMDPTIPPIDDLVFITLEDKDGNNHIIADYYIEDITEDMNIGS
mgnify:CR=1 FL=1